MEQLTNNPVSSGPVGAGFAPPPPRLGPQVPGMTGGLPGLAGLSVTENPMARQLQSYGRGQDSMLVHMTPGEVQSLRGLAQLTGGDLTQNPHTGLPEAGWLGNLLPTIIGGLLSFIPGVAPWMIGLAGTVGGTAATGNLGKGLMMGLGAFGGASLGGALGAGKVFAGGATSGASTTGSSLGSSLASQGAATTGATLTPVASAAAPVATTAAGVPTAFSSELIGAGAPNLISSSAQGVAGIAPTVGNTVAQNLVPQVVGNTAEAAASATAKPGLLGAFKNASAKGLGPGMLAKAAPYAAGLGVLGNVAEALKPGPMKDEEEKTNFPYEGPYGSHRLPNGSIQFYKKDGTPFQPGTATTPAVPYYARGGHVQMEEGSFVFPARETAELGNGSSRAGQEVLARLGGRPIDGSGDGVSDSIRARIGGSQDARVARDEVYFDPQSVARVGGGDHKRGTQKLYALMDRATKARKRAAVGADTKLRRGIV